MAALMALPNCLLQVINLNATQMTNHGVEALLNSIADGIFDGNPSYVQSLELQRNEFFFNHSSQTSLIKIVNHSSLLQLDLGFNAIGDNGLITFC